MHKVVVVDDKEMMRDSIAATLRRAGMQVLPASGGEAALELIAKDRPDAVVTDFKMPGMTGVELLEKIREIDMDLPVVLMTAFGTIDSAVEAMRLGAYDYLTKPFEGDELLIAVKRAIRHASVVRENALLKASIQGGSGSSRAARSGLSRLIGSSSAMRRVRQQVEAVAGSQGTVLICGESGSGKEVVARAIHESGPRRDGPFLAVNCAALSEGLLESELFGHERGAFTGADRLRKGRFELAHGGTLLLDEVSEVSPQVQSKLLRVLQEREFERVGSSRTIGVDVRVIATSNRDLPAEVATGGFRQDLFFRLNVLPLHMPAMRERLDDVAGLVEYFIGQIIEREGCEAMTVEPEAIEQMSRYAWPGNVREVQNVCERAVVLMAARQRAGESGADRISRELVAPWLTLRAMPIQGAAHPMSNGRLPMQAIAGSRNGAPASAVYESKFARGMADAFGGGAGSLIGDGSGGEPGGGGGGGEHDTPIPLEQIEREAIIRTLRQFNGHRQKTAKALGIGVRTLGLKLKKWKELQIVEATL